jgi:transcriptional regulator with XRE-family HTH domain
MKREIITRLLLWASEKNMNASQFADKLGIARQSVSGWKRGEHAPTLDLLCEIFNIFPDLDANWLFGREAKTGATQNQDVTGNKNYTSMAGKDMVNEPSMLQQENKYLKQLIKEKDEQITLLKHVLKHK